MYIGLNPSNYIQTRNNSRILESRIVPLQSNDPVTNLSDLVTNSWIEPPPPSFSEIFQLSTGISSTILPSYDESIIMIVKEFPPKYSISKEFESNRKKQEKIDEDLRKKKIKEDSKKAKDKAKIEKDKAKRKLAIKNKAKHNTELQIDKANIETHWNGFGKFCNGCLGGMVFTGGLSIMFIPVGFVLVSGFWCGKYIKYKIKKNIYKLL
jgi:hypothetical protein